MRWKAITGERPASEVLAKACADFGITVEEAMLEKALEVELRTYLRAIPNHRISARQYVEFVAAAFAPRGVPDWIPALLADVGRGPALTEQQLIELENRQHGRCALCGVFLTRASQPHVDHMVPIALRGESSMANYQLLCATCNLGKSKLLGWIMGAPFLSEGHGAPTAKQRFCVLSRAEGKCEIEDCDADSSSAELRVVTRVNEGRGGRWIFDNMMAMCREHANARDAESLREARRAVMRAATSRR